MAKTSGSVQDQPFSIDGFIHYLTRWIIIDDQVCVIPQTLIVYYYR
jgi:hypothetical protein